MSRTIIPGKVLTLHADYLQQSLLNPKELVANARSALKGIKFDTMVSRGLSGALVVPMLARALRKNWLIIRKDNDGSHSSKKVEGTLGERWMFIDDLVSSGHTRKICFEAVDDLCRECNFASAFVGTWTYTNDAYYDEESDACTYEQLRQRSPLPMAQPCEVPQPMPMPVFPAPKDWMITTALLWQPSPERIARARLTDFATFTSLSEARGREPTPGQGPTGQRDMSRKPGYGEAPVRPLPV